MYESYKSFSLEDKMWNQSFYDASKNRDKKKIFELLSKAGNVYLDEYSIDHSIFELYNANLSAEKKEKVLENLNNNKYVRFIRKYGTVGFREVIPTRILKQNFCETSCYGCEFCIKLCEKNNLIR